MAFIFVQIFVLLVFWRPQEWLIRVLYNWPLLDIAVGAAILAIIIDVNEKRQRIFKSPVAFLYVGLFVAAMMSHIVHTYYEGMIWTFEATWKLAVASILFFLVLDRPSRLRSIAWIFVIMACIMTVHALMQDRTGRGFAGQPPMISYRPGHDEPIQRSIFFGIFEDPNDLAQILAAALPFAFALAARRNIASLIIALVISWFLISGIATTHSRGGEIGLVAAVVFLVVLLFPGKWMPWIYGILIIIALGLCPFSGPYLDDSAHDRVIFWGEANWVFKKNPIFGVGFRMFEEAIQRGNAAHNCFVLCYTELGVFGYWFWFSLLQYGFIGCLRVHAKLSDVKDTEARYLYHFAGIVLAATGSYLASGYFLTRAFVYPLFFLAGLMNAVPLIAQRYLPPSEPPLMDIRKDLFIKGTIGSLLSIIYIYISILLLNKAAFG